MSVIIKIEITNMKLGKPPEIQSLTHRQKPIHSLTNPHIQIHIVGHTVTHSHINSQTDRDSNDRQTDKSLYRH